jgi:hypothetical protein
MVEKSQSAHEIDLKEEADQKEIKNKQLAYGDWEADVFERLHKTFINVCLRQRHLF